MNLKDLGYRPYMEEYRQEHGLGDLLIGRVAAEHRERYHVQSEQGMLECELLGNLRFSAESRSDLPAVGDWVAMSPYDVGKALIHAVLPRYSVLERQAVGKFGEKQIIATNIDVGIIVLSVNRDFNINRVERYLTICHASGIEPMIILTKTDLIPQPEVQQLLDRIRTRIPEVPLLAISNLSGQGIDDLKKHILKGKTYCLLGSSGVGKSSLINSLSGEVRMEIGEISEMIDRGKHVTTHRELIPMVNGGILIDNPGMREVGITDGQSGLESTFGTIYALAGQCKFTDCTHTSEVGCAVLEAVRNGELDEQALENFHKMERENARFTTSIREKHKKDKSMGKLYKEIKAHRKRKKF